MFQYLGTFSLLLQMFAEDLCNSLHDRDVVALCRSWPKESLPGEGGSMESDHLGGSMPHCFEPLNDQLRAGQSDKRHIGIGWIMPNRWVQIFDSDRATRDFTAVFTWARRKGRLCHWKYTGMSGFDLLSVKISDRMSNNPSDRMSRVYRMSKVMDS